MPIDPLSLLEFHQNRKIAQAEAAAADAKHKAVTVESRVEELEHRQEKLALICQTLWEIIEEKIPVNPEDLFKRMEEIDLRDGIKDGRIGESIFECRKCGRKIRSRRQFCIYCGEENKGEHIVE
jgi:hypothetical protein